MEVKSPPSRRKKISKYEKLDDLTLSDIRRKVHDLFFLNERPTLDKVLNEVNADDTLPKFSRTGLYRVLKNKLNFKYAQGTCKSLLVDKNKIVAWRVTYLEKIKRMRNEGKIIYYLDEMWINEESTKQFVLHDTTMKSIGEDKVTRSNGSETPTGKGKHLIICHIGSTEGFLRGGEMIFEAMKQEGNDHLEIDTHIFEKWFEDILTKVECGSVIVLDNADYHCRKVEKTPKWPTTPKAEVQEWLKQKNIDFSEDEIKAELMEKVKKHKHKYKAYVIDKMAQEKQVTILRLPPFHCELNPMELIWAPFNSYVTRNKSLKHQDVSGINIADAIASVTPEIWQNCIKHIVEEEERMRRLDGIIDDMVDRYIHSSAGDDEEDSESDSN